MKIERKMNGIYLGVNLFIAYETGRKPLNTKISSHSAYADV